MANNNVLDRMHRRDLDPFWGQGFDDFFASPIFTSENFMKTDIKENEKSYILEVEVPGCKKEDIKMNIEDGYLKISASREAKHVEGDQSRYIRREKAYGTYARSFHVGNLQPEDIQATYDDGELIVIIPKETPEKKDAATAVTIH